MPPRPHRAARLERPRSSRRDGAATEARRREGVGTRALLAKTRKLLAIVAVPAWRRALVGHRVAAGAEHRPVLRDLGEVHTVVDIGANRGQFALAVRSCLPSARILSFEPLPEPAARYRAVFEGDAQATLWEAAVGDHVGNATMHVSRRDDSSSLLPITELQEAVHPGGAEAYTTTVEIGSLSTYVSADSVRTPALLKLDVQGFELRVLAGCEDQLDRFTWVYAECSFVELYRGQAMAHEVVSWLASRHFRLKGIYNVDYDASGRALQGDFLFQRSGPA